MGRDPRSHLIGDCWRLAGWLTFDVEWNFTLTAWFTRDRKLNRALVVGEEKSRGNAPLRGAMMDVFREVCVVNVDEWFLVYTFSGKDCDTIGVLYFCFVHKFKLIINFSFFQVRMTLLRLLETYANIKVSCIFP